MREDEWFHTKITEIKRGLQGLVPENFDNPTDYMFRQASMEGEAQAYQNAMVDYKKFVKESSEEDTAIVMHKHLKAMSDQHRIELGEVEKVEQQEVEDVIKTRGRLNGMIDGYNYTRLHFDSMTSEHAAEAQRRGR